ncbi:hypothetical protein PG993_006863 [Apiospora rasikravindrae]|uniref:Uncharacterized protein n=1 Tax=Apiospora rasikravindrae TaxID=990691 RepID=A0ABR1SW63_9PEZI
MGGSQVNRGAQAGVSAQAEHPKKTLAQPLGEEIAGARRSLSQHPSALLGLKDQVGLPKAGPSQETPQAQLHDGTFAVDPQPKAPGTASKRQESRIATSRRRHPRAPD